MTVNRADFLPTVLRTVGCEVVTYNGWAGRGGDFTNLRAVVWHHDASPPGDSPGVPAYMLRQQAAGQAWAQLWVSRQGVWHILGAGVAWHAGRVLPGMPTNSTSLGVETDHTNGEAWPTALLDSLRRGTAAILAHLGRDEGALHMHKTICDPLGRKSDPDGLDLTLERARVRRILGALSGSLTTPPAPTVLEDDMAVIARGTGTKQYLTDLLTTKRHILSTATVAGLKADGVRELLGAEYDGALAALPEGPTIP